MSKAKDEYYKCYPEGLKRGDGTFAGAYIEELEQQNKEMLSMLVERVKVDWIFIESGEITKDEIKREIDVIENITGKPIKEALKDE